MSTSGAALNVPTQLQSVIHTHNSADDLLFQANAQLAAGHPDIALDLYTKVLYEVSPGHLCAFLNRALAYIQLGYPELGVVDAYRAKCICQKLRSNVDLSPTDDAPYQAIKSYIQSEKTHCEVEETWTLEPNCYTGDRWKSLNLANIVLVVRTESDLDLSTDLPWDLLFVTATYRMAGALSECGLGAKGDALGIIEDIMNNTMNRSAINRLSREEWSWFRSLGDSTMMACTRDLREHPGMARALMDLKVTLVDLVVYPWNEHVPDLSLYSHARDLITHAAQIIDDCEFRSSKEAETTDGTLHLRAAENIYNNKMILKEGSHLQVTTAASKDIGYCDECAAILQFEEAKPPAQGNDLEIPSHSSWTNPFPYSNLADRRQRQRESRLQVPASPEPPMTPPHRRNYPFNDHLVCHRCNETTWCSEECFESSRDHHGATCDLGLEESIRTYYAEILPMFERQDHSIVPGFMKLHPKARCLYDLMFVRALSLAIEKDVHVLDLPEVKWLNAGFRAPRPFPPLPNPKDEASPDLNPATEKRRLPWTLMNNVILPLHYLETMLVDSILNLQMVDGWVINTLFAKIMYSTRISQGPRITKNYNTLGQFVSEEPSGPNEFDEDVWVGTIYPIFSLIRTANEKIGEKPNVTISERSQIKCYAIEDEPCSHWIGYGTERICLVPGEFVLRAPDYGNIVRYREEQEEPDS
ncbi:hypothetical protein MMC19_002767 [Ptychographa xylographoides]|nr:hypothetical protein [Ptychographa xylographoides]